MVWTISASNSRLLQVSPKITSKHPTAHISVRQYNGIPVNIGISLGMKHIEFVHTIGNPTLNGKIKVYYTF